MIRRLIKFEEAAAGDITAKSIIDKLCDIQKEKVDSSEKHVPIGFCA